jgi:energy-coupling factor transporter ATP-binding protein EcfA2
MKKYLTRNVFTPTLPAKLTFVDRNEINERVVDAIRQPGKQIVVYGHTGSGKTTLLLNKLNQLYGNHITSRCTENITVEQLKLDAFDKLNSFYTSEITTKKTKKLSTDIGSEYSAIKAIIKTEISSENGSKIQKLVPPQLTAQRLAEFLGAANCCWVIEDFHKTKENEKEELSQIIKVFMDTASDYPEVKIIAIGAVGTAREVVGYDKEMQNRVAEIYVPLMNTIELMEIMNKGENYLNIRIKKEVKDRIVDLANGLGAVCHQLCLNMCVLEQINESVDTPHYFKETNLDQAVEKYLNEQSDSFKAIFENAIKVKRKGGKFENGKLLLTALSMIENEFSNHNEILTEIHKIDSKYPASNLTSYLKRLTSAEKDEILRYDEKSGKYSFSNPFLKVYSRMLLQKESLQKIQKGHSINNFNINNSNLVIGTSNVIIQQNSFVNKVNIVDDFNRKVDRQFLDLLSEFDQLLEIMMKTSDASKQQESINFIKRAKEEFLNGYKDSGVKFLSLSGDWAYQIAKENNLIQISKLIEDLYKYR